MFRIRARDENVAPLTASTFFASACAGVRPMNCCTMPLRSTRWKYEGVSWLGRSLMPLILPLVNVTDTGTGPR